MSYGYESADSFKCYNCDFTEYCTSCRDTLFSTNCRNCTDVFGCVNLRNKSFCVFNRQLNEDEYKTLIARLKKYPPQQILNIVEELKKRYPLTQTKENGNVNTTYGNYIHHDKNCYMCFDAANDENCAYVYDTFYCKNVMDATYAGQAVELSYEIVDCPDMFNCHYAVQCKNCNDTHYTFNCYRIKNCIGCIGLRDKQYCILNRQLTQEEYAKISQALLIEFKNKKTGWSNLAY